MNHPVRKSTRDAFHSSAAHPSNSSCWQTCVWQMWTNDRASIITIWGCLTSISHKHSEGSGGVEGKKRNKMERMQEARQILIVCVGVLYKSNLQNCAVLLCSIVVLGAKVLANCRNMGVLCHFLPLKSHFIQTILSEAKLEVHSRCTVFSSSGSL